MDDRNLYDLGFETHRIGEMGRLQTLGYIPVVAGDSFEINMDLVFRLAPLRREIVSEVQIDIACFYIPYRHIYPNWNNMVQEGYNTSETWTGFAIGANDRFAPYLGLNRTDASIPLWIIEGYNRIWNRYYRVPSAPPDGNFTLYPSGASNASMAWKKYGRSCARLPHVLNNGIALNQAGGASPSQPWRDFSDAQAEVSAAGGVIDIRDVAQVQGHYRSKIERQWNSERYTDVLQRVWGTSVNIDADQRPELCFHHRALLSGTEVNGTDDATLGAYIGKTMGRVEFNMPRKMFDEHGTFWMLALLRFPTKHTQETHPLARKVSPASDYLMADPNIWKNMAPALATPQDWLTQGTAVGTQPSTYEPYGQHYRNQPNFIHAAYETIPGYPFSNFSVPIGPDQVQGPLYYSQPGEFDPIFQSWQLSHWQCSGAVNVNAYRYIPTINQSIYAGAS